MTGTAGEISGKLGAKKKREGDDFFIDPDWCTRVLLKHQMLFGACWDPACGTGTIPMEVRKIGYQCYGTDKVDRGYGGMVLNFLLDPAPRFMESRDIPVGTIITNPPYKHAQAFLERAIMMRGVMQVILLVQSKFLYSGTRYPIFTGDAGNGFKCSKIIHLSDRPSMPPGEEFLAGTVKRGGGKLDYCWVVFTRGHTGPALTYWARNPDKPTRRKS